MNSDAIVASPIADAKANVTPAKPSLKVHALVNVRAGTAMGLQHDAMRALIANAFEAEGHRIEVDILPPEQLDQAIADAAKSDIDVLVVGGGDGTIRTAATHLIGTDKALGILPLGTMNRLAKDLEIPLDLVSAASYLATATPSRIDVAKVNGSIFMCNSLMGLTLRYSVARARMRGKPATQRLPKYIATIREILSSRDKISITVDNGEDRMRLRVLSVAVTNNGYDENLTWLRRPRLDGGKLTMYISKHRSGWGLAMAVGRALLGRWHGDPEMAKFTGQSFVINSPRRLKRLANDGEISKFETPLHYEICPLALAVMTHDTQSPVAAS